MLPSVFWRPQHDQRAKVPPRMSCLRLLQSRREEASAPHHTPHRDVYEFSEDCDETADLTTLLKEMNSAIGLPAVGRHVDMKRDVQLPNPGAKGSRGKEEDELKDDGKDGGGNKRGAALRVACDEGGSSPDAEERALGAEEEENEGDGMGLDQTRVPGDHGDSSNEGVRADEEDGNIGGEGEEGTEGEAGEGGAEEDEGERGESEVWVESEESEEQQDEAAGHSSDTQEDEKEDKTRANMKVKKASKGTPAGKRERTRRLKRCQDVESKQTKQKGAGGDPPIAVAQPDGQGQPAVYAVHTPSASLLDACFVQVQDSNKIKVLITANSERIRIKKTIAQELKKLLFCEQPSSNKVHFAELDMWPLDAAGNVLLPPAAATPSTAVYQVWPAASINGGPIKCAIAPRIKSPSRRGDVHYLKHSPGKHGAPMHTSAFHPRNLVKYGILAQEDLDAGMRLKSHTHTLYKLPGKRLLLVVDICMEEGGAPSSSAPKQTHGKGATKATAAKKEKCEPPQIIIDSINVWRTKHKTAGLPPDAPAPLTQKKRQAGVGGNDPGDGGGRRGGSAKRVQNENGDWNRRSGVKKPSEQEVELTQSLTKMLGPAQFVSGDSCRGGQNIDSKTYNISDGFADFVRPGDALQPNAWGPELNAGGGTCLVLPQTTDQHFAAAVCICVNGVTIIPLDAHLGKKMEVKGSRAHIRMKELHNEVRKVLVAAKTPSSSARVMRFTVHQPRNSELLVVVAHVEYSAEATAVKPPAGAAARNQQQHPLSGDDMERQKPKSSSDGKRRPVAKRAAGPAVDGQQGSKRQKLDEAEDGRRLRDRGPSAGRQRAPGVRELQEEAADRQQQTQQRRQQQQQQQQHEEEEEQEELAPRQQPQEEQQEQQVEQQPLPPGPQMEPQAEDLSSELQLLQQRVAAAKQGKADVEAELKAATQAEGTAVQGLVRANEGFKTAKQEWREAKNACDDSIQQPVAVAKQTAEEAEAALDKAKQQLEQAMGHLTNVQAALEVAKLRPMEAEKLARLALKEYENALVSQAAHKMLARYYPNNVI